jgi:hypothetical protein
LRCGEVVSSERLVDTLWGEEPPRDSANALQRHISSLRRLLGRPDMVRRRSAAYALDVSSTSPAARSARRVRPTPRPPAWSSPA